MKKTRIILADDHQLMLDGIMSALIDDPSVEVAAAVQNGHQLIDAVIANKPDLVVLDLNMPGYDGLQCIEKIKHDFPGVKILVLSSYSQPDLVMTVKKMGVDGYLVKNSTANELVDVITLLASGNSYFQSLEGSSLPEDHYYFDPFLKKYHLTKREVEIIGMVCKEFTTKQIASSLFLSELTVNTHRRNIMKKLSLKNTAGLINFAKENGIV